MLSTPQIHDLVVLTPSNTLGGAGDIAPSGAVDPHVAALDQYEPGFQASFDAWQDAGGQVGTLADGPAADLFQPAISDGNTILIDTTQVANSAQAQIRLWHEFQHVLYGGGPNGGALSKCEHYVLWVDTMLFALEHLGQLLECADYEFQHAAASSFARSCYGHAVDDFANVPPIPEWCK